MIKQWYTARELAELELDGMPKTKLGIIKKGQKENWKSRERSFGKGKEYHISNLPDAVQMSLISAVVGQKNLQALACKAASLEMVQERGRAKFTDQERITARLSIVSLFENFRLSCGLRVLDAEHAFIKLYKAEKDSGHSEIVPSWIFEVYPEFSVQSLRLWRSNKKSKALREMMPKYGNRKGTGIIERANNGALKNFIVALITKQSHLTAGHVRDMCRSAFGESVSVIDAKTGEEMQVELPKIRSIERFIQSWKDENKGLYLSLTNPDAYKNSYQPAFGKADAYVRNLNQIWEFDASPVDAMCMDGRYNIYGIIDVYSRRTIFMVTKTAATEGSLLLIRRAILEWGVPETIRTDNGSDFKSYQFQSALVSLGINQELCIAYTPESKGFVERSFRTLQHDLMPLLPGFIGHNVADRKAIEQSKAFSQRLGESEKESFKIDMTAQELQKYIDEWAAHRYGDRVHSTTKETPNERARNWVGSINRIENERVLDIFLAPIASGGGYRKVTKTGIRTDNATFISAVLGIYIGETVFVRHHPDDLGRIYVFKSETGDFICEAINHESLGISGKEASKEAKALQKAVHAEKRKEIKSIQRSIKPRDMVETILKRDAENSPNVITFRSSTPHITPAITSVQNLTNSFEPKTTTKLSDAQKAAHETLVSEMAAPKSEVIELNSKEGRIKRALSLEVRLTQGNRISAEDQHWLSKYQKLPEYIAHKQMREAFGSAWFEEKGV